jgi:hypothetical protein
LPERGHQTLYARIHPTDCDRRPTRSTCEHALPRTRPRLRTDVAARDVTDRARSAEGSLVSSAPLHPTVPRPCGYALEATPHLTPPEKTLVVARRRPIQTRKLPLVKRDATTSGDASTSVTASHSAAPAAVRPKMDAARAAARSVAGSSITYQAAGQRRPDAAVLGSGSGSWGRSRSGTADCGGERGDPHDRRPPATCDATQAVRPRPSRLVRPGSGLRLHPWLSSHRASGSPTMTDLA